MLPIMNPDDFRDPMTFPLSTSRGYVDLSEMSQQLLNGRP